MSGYLDWLRIGYAGTNWNTHLIGLELVPLGLKSEIEAARAHSTSGLGEQ